MYSLSKKFKQLKVWKIKKKWNYPIMPPPDIATVYRVYL